jgi:phosphoinositide 3-kinase adaptor protein 1
MSNIRVSQVTFEDSLLPGTDLKIRNSRLQIVVVCPVFLERAAERPEHAATISRQLNTERVLAMMLGVQDIHLNTEHRAALVTYPSWRKFFVKDQDETFVGQFLGAAVAILGTAIASNLKNDKTAFSVHPKKVKLVSQDGYRLTRPLRIPLSLRLKMAPFRARRSLGAGQSK